jgi:hypothetical protein
MMLSLDQPFRPLADVHFCSGGIYYLQFQGRNVRQVCWLFSLLFYYETGGNIFLRVGCKHLQDYATYLRRQLSSNKENVLIVFRLR